MNNADNLLRDLIAKKKPIEEVAASFVK